jgi:hypothetical protein
MWSTPQGIRMMLPNATETTAVSGAGAFSAMVATPGGAIVAAWEENGAIATARF